MDTGLKSDITKFLSIIDKNDVSILKEEQDNNRVLNEGANPHKVSLPVQMAMQHYQKDAVKKDSVLKKYFKEAEESALQITAERKKMLSQYAQKISNKILERSRGI
jgi:hypothetical protein